MKGKVGQEAIVEEATASSLVADSCVGAFVTRRHGVDLGSRVIHRVGGIV